MDLVKNKLEYIDKCYLNEVPREGGSWVDIQYIRITDISIVKAVVNIANYGHMDVTLYQLENIIKHKKEITVDEWVMQTL